MRADAFDYLQLPFKLLSGRVGRVQVQASEGGRSWGNQEGSSALV